MDEGAARPEAPQVQEDVRKCRNVTRSCRAVTLHTDLLVLILFLEIVERGLPSLLLFPKTVSMAFLFFFHWFMLLVFLSSLAGPRKLPGLWWGEALSGREI